MVTVLVFRFCGAGPSGKGMCIVEVGRGSTQEVVDEASRPIDFRRSSQGLASPIVEEWGW